jgi:hypothetical protein
MAALEIVEVITDNFNAAAKSKRKLGKELGQ